MSKEEFSRLYSSLPRDKQEVIETILMSFAPQDRVSGWISVSDAAAILKVSPNTVRTKIHMGIIPYRNCSQRKTLVERKAVEALAQIRA